MPLTPILKIFLKFHQNFRVTKTGEGVEPFVYPLTSLRDPEILMEFKENFQNWCQGHEI